MLCATTVEVPSSDEESNIRILTAVPEAKTDDLHTFILDDSARMVLGVGIRSVQVHLAAAHQKCYYNNDRVHQTTHSIPLGRKLFNSSLIEA